MYYEIQNNGVGWSIYRDSKKYPPISRKFPKKERNKAIKFACRTTEYRYTLYVYRYSSQNMVQYVATEYRYTTKVYRYSDITVLKIKTEYRYTPNMYRYSTEMLRQQATGHRPHGGMPPSSKDAPKWISRRSLEHTPQWESWSLYSGPKDGMPGMSSVETWTGRHTSLGAYVLTWHGPGTK